MAGLILTVYSLADSCCYNELFGYLYTYIFRYIFAGQVLRTKKLKIYGVVRQVAVEGERLRRLRERVEAQELKLRRLKALRGQLDRNKQANIALSKYIMLYSDPNLHQYFSYIITNSLWFETEISCSSHKLFRYLLYGTREITSLDHVYSSVQK